MDWQSLLLDNWPVKLVCAILIVAAWIDGKQLRVPNWITFPMVFAGLAYNSWAGGWTGLGDALFGMVVGLATLLPLYAIGGMGAGDVKLMAGIGAWLGATVTWHAFCVSVVVGALMAIVMVLWRKSWQKHYGNFMMILLEFLTVKNPRELSRIAAERKPQMLLLPYGIPICIGSIAYFMYAGMI
ncbi:Type 4 prepilin-like proteins leader peptide-processing enzyme [Maioricimonas rarisocia]|uniref:Type 4 prepilin-like proteins leader peptide-processing enzyme n=1 Tax=Maioricimonas rarisocia TaxID=2528026 RepID=A0A517ZE22_9PLAN|nr:A24 family peptidase [Maioricimonas rarisocia]QDU40733.1 Type 4 prepilin-like proteins leader peptide-processing enzyme [Maioricimonas rarisocia]